MAVDYSLLAINARLQAVANTIDGGATGGFMLLYSGGVLVSTIQLFKPCGTVSGGVLSFIGGAQDPSAAGNGLITEARITDSNSNLVIFGLTVGIPGQGLEVTITNGSNTTLITSGQQIVMLAGQIQGS